MTPVLGVIIFLVLFAVLMMAVGLGSRFLEMRGKKQMETMLNPGSAAIEERETSILVAPTERDPLDAFLERSALQGKIQTLLQQGGLQWAPSHLLVAMAVGAVAGGFLGFVLRPLGFVTASVLAFAFVLGGAPLFYVRYKRSCPPEGIGRAASGSAGFSGALDARGTRFFDQPGDDRRGNAGPAGAGIPRAVCRAQPGSAHRSGHGQLRQASASAGRAPVHFLGCAAAADRRQFERGSDAAGFPDSRAIPAEGPSESGQRPRTP